MYEFTSFDEECAELLSETFPMTMMNKEISSPTSVAQDASVHTIEPIALTKQQEEQNHEQHRNEPKDVCSPRKRKCEDEWVCPASSKSRRTINPVRQAIMPIIEKIKLHREDNKFPISLAQGDPSAGGDIGPCKQAVDALVNAALTKPQVASYANACGTPEARQAIAKYHSYPEHRILPDDVIVANGCSGALELALTSLLDPGSILLVPQPGFPLYQTIAESHGASVVHYRLDPNKRWECDLGNLEQLLSVHEGKVRAMVVNNPSSTTGSVFSLRHIQQILEVARRHRLPIVSDEVHGELAFGSSQFHPIAQVAAQLGRHVPVITASGISKQFLLPGWRVGWLTFHDNISKSMRHVEDGAKRLAQVSMGASQLPQSAIPTLLSDSDEGLNRWKQDLKNSLERKAHMLYSMLSQCDGLQVLRSQGSMFTVVKVDTELLNVADDMDFASKLIDEENVIVLPGTTLGVPNTFRVAFCSREPILQLAAKRIFNFCHNRTKLV